MTHTLVKLFAPVLGLAFIAAAFAPAGQALAAPPAAVIATVDLEKVFDGLSERNTKQDELKVYGEGLLAELNKLGQQVKDEESKAALLPEGPERRAANARVVELKITVKVKQELYQAMLDQQRGEMFRYLYNKIAAAVKRMAQDNKYTLVIASDESVAVPAGVQSSEVQRVISLRRLLFVDPRHDITNDLITMMNNEFKAVGGKPSTPATPPSK